MAWMMYANEHKGRFCSSETQSVFNPGAGDYWIMGATPLPTGFWSWIGTSAQHHEITYGLLWPYIKDLQVYSCPNQPVLPNTTYVINGLLAGRVGVPELKPPAFGVANMGHGGRTYLSLSELKHTERVFVFIEAMGHIDDGDGDFDEDDVGPGFEYNKMSGGFGSPIYPFRVSQCPGLYHGLSGSNGCTIAFADGHALFWQYAGNPTDEFNTKFIKLPAPDLEQLQA